MAKETEKLTENEALQLENLNLKRQLLDGLQTQLLYRISQRTNIPPEELTINLDTREIKKK